MTSNSRARGVTLLEAVLVMVLLVTAAAIVTPRFSDFVPSLQVDQSARHLLAWLRKAHAEAALTGTRHRFVLEPETRAFWIESETAPLKEPGKFRERTGAWKREILPAGVGIQDLQGFKTDGARRHLEFLPDGTAADASLTIANDRGEKQTVKVTGATGRVVIESPEAP